MNMDDVVTILDKTLQEETTADQNLTQVAESVVNAEEAEGDEEQREAA